MAYDGFALTLRTKVKAARNDTVEGHTSNSAANAHHKAAARLRRREAQAFAASIGERKGARVAIVGAGPTGLWLAVLIARKHASFAKGPNGLVITRRHNAPTVDVFEKREKRRPGADERAHGARSIVLAITQQTSALLNRHLHSPHGFAPISRVGQIESVLLAEFERYAAAGFGRTQFGEEVSDPDELHARGYDVVFVASGRRHASDAWRAARGMESLVDSTSAATVLEFWGATPSSDLWASAAAAASRPIAPARLFMRPGADAGRGWIWLVGLPEPLSEKVRRGVQGGAQDGAHTPQKVCALQAVLQAVLAEGAGARDGAISLPGAAATLEALAVLGTALTPTPLATAACH